MNCFDKLEEAAKKLARAANLSYSETLHILQNLGKFEINKDTVQSAELFLKTLEENAMNKTMSVSLKDGTEIRGTESQIKGILDKLGYPKNYLDSFYYDSDSKGKVLIKEMASQHIKNAIIKEIKKELESHRYDSNFDFYSNLSAIVYNGDEGVVQSLLTELGNRTNGE